MMKHRTRKGGHRKRGPLSAAHRKAISEGLKRHHRGGGKKRKSSTGVRRKRRRRHLKRV